MGWGQMGYKAEKRQNILKNYYESYDKDTSAHERPCRWKNLNTIFVTIHIIHSISSIIITRSYPTTKTVEYFSIRPILKTRNFGNGSSNIYRITNKLVYKYNCLQGRLSTSFYSFLLFISSTTISATLDFLFSRTSTHFQDLNDENLQNNY